MIAPRTGSQRDTLRQLAPILLLAWTLLNWGWTCWFGFTNDDFVWIAGADLTGRSDWFSQAVFPHYWSWLFFRPLVQLSFVFNYLACGLHPSGYHLVNVALHTANVFLVWRLALRSLGSAAVALMTAMVFAVHPTVSDAVAWLSGRTELLCAFFYLLAILAHLNGRLGWALVLFALALSSKESGISLPLVVLAADWFGLGERRRIWRHAGAYAAVVALYLLVRSAIVRVFAGELIGLSPLSPFRTASAMDLLRTKVTLFGQYLLEPIPVHGFIRSALVLSLGFLLVLGYAQRSDPRTQRAIRFAVAWVGFTLLPYVAWPRFYGLYVYLAIIGMSLLLVTLAGRMASLLAGGRYRALIPIGLAAWLVASAVQLQTTNEYERRAGLLSLQIVRSLVAAAPSPPPGTLFAVTGLEQLRYGLDSWVGHRGVLDFGLPEAMQLWFRDRTLDVTFDAGNARSAAAERPLIYLHWDTQAGAARRMWPAPEE